MINKYFDSIYRYLTGNMTREELDSFETWLNESAKNKEIFEYIKTGWIFEGEEHKSSLLGKRSTWKNIMKKTGYLNGEYKKYQKLQTLKLISRAAILIIGLFLGALSTYFGITSTKMGSQIASLQPKTVNNDTIVIEANKASRSEILLPDGSKVWLNNGSKIKMLPAFYTGKRTIYLTGEAYFDVAKKKENDYFRVKTSDDIQIKVLGTQFNLKAYPEERTIETTLEEGSVVIEKEVNDKAILVASLSPNEKAIFIRKEAQLNINHKDLKTNNIQKNSLKQVQTKEQVIIRENVDTKLYTSWKEGHLVFKDESFKNIVTLMERWYDVSIKIQNKSLEDLRFTANFKNETVHQALYALKLTHPFTYTHNIENNLILIK